MASGLGTDLDGSYLSDGLHAELHVTSEENLLTSGDNSHSISGQLDSSGTAGASADNSNEDAELEAIKARVREMEEEAEKLKEMQNEVEKQMNMTSPPSTPGATSTFLTFEEKGEVDSRSVYVGNVDYSATAEELEAHFHGCGSINRVTILCNKFTGHPKGYAYVEFSEKDAVKMAETLDESLFKGRPIKVTPKRTNRPGISSTDYPPRGRGRGRYRGGFYNQYGGGGGYYRPRGRFRSRRASWYTPY